MLFKNCIRFSALCIATLPFVFTANGQSVGTRTDAFLENLLKGYPQYFDSASRKATNVQVIYTTIDRGANGIAGLKHYYFNVNNQQYFHPASAVNLPVAMLTLQKLNELKANGIDKHTTMLTEKSYSGQTAVYNDPTTPNGKPTIAQYVKKMLMVSDNDACNRLYEFLGQQYINEQLRQKGYTDAQIAQRLNIDLTEDENRHTNPVQFLAPGNKLLYRQPMQVSNTTFALRNDSLGKAGFSNKNHISLEELHNMLISLVFPNKVTSSQRFNLTDDDRKFILKYMSQLPTESYNPPYMDDTATYYHAYGKYLMFGATRDSLPSGIRIFNKVGQAYGQLLDVAYVVDFDKKIEFFLSAVIYCNNDGTGADDKYDYNSIGLPFMKKLGEIIYGHEAKREKRIVPDLGEVKMEYDRR